MVTQSEVEAGRGPVSEARHDGGGAPSPSFACFATLRMVPHPRNCGAGYASASARAGEGARALRQQKLRQPVRRVVARRVVERGAVELPARVSRQREEKEAARLAEMQQDVKPERGRNERTSVVSASTAWQRHRFQPSVKRICG